MHSYNEAFLFLFCFEPGFLQPTQTGSNSPCSSDLELWVPRLASQVAGVTGLCRCPQLWSSVTSIQCFSTSHELAFTKHFLRRELQGLFKEPIFPTQECGRMAIRNLFSSRKNRELSIQDCTAWSEKRQKEFAVLDSSPPPNSQARCRFLPTLGWRSLC